MALAIWIAFTGYALAALLVAWRGAARATEGDFWTAGRSLPWGHVGMSISAGFLSVSWSCVYAVQLFYWYGIGALWLMTIPWLLALGGIHLLARRYRGLDAFSQPEMVGRRFGPASRRLVATAVALVFLAWGGAEIYVAAQLLAPALGVAAPAVILWIGVLVAAYSMLGGFRAVVDTDRLQYVIVAAYILTMAWIALRGLQASGRIPAGAGFVAAGRALAADPPAAALSGLPWTAPLAPGVMLILLTLVAYLPGWLFETDLWLRVQAARDDAAARRGVAFAMANSLVFVGIVPLFIGVAALAIYRPVGGVIPPELGADGDAIFAALVSDFAPPWLAVLVAAGLVAAATSTIDTCANVTALSVAYDLLGAGTDPPGRQGGRRARIATLGAVIASCLFALGTESLWDVFYLSSGLLTTAVALPVAAVMIPGLGARAVRWSSAAGLAATTAAYVGERAGTLTLLEPRAVAASGLGFILWGALGALVGCALGQARD